MIATYECPLCGATKTIKKPDHEPVPHFLDALPKRLHCGVRGCYGHAVVIQMNAREYALAKALEEATNAGNL